MTLSLQRDALVIGGGIAGLWLAARLKRAGYAVLVAADQLGGGQTVASQGIVHGGVKYALGGLLGEDSAALADAPAIWRRALAGEGEVDLRRAGLLSTATYLWGAGDLLSRIAVPAAAFALSSDSRSLPTGDWPPALRDAPGVAAVRRLDEPVLDLPSVVGQLARDLDCVAIRRDGFHFDDARVRLDLAMGHALAVEAAHVFVVAGGGNERALTLLGEPAERAQRRPLQMVMAKGPLPALFGHLVGAGDKPRLTVTTHRAADGVGVWYLGGALAEDAAGMTEADAISAARALLGGLLSKALVDRLHFATLPIDRAEAAGSGGRRPPGPIWLESGRYAIGWPGKLALAPKLAEAALRRMRAACPDLAAAPVSDPLPAGLPRPPLASAPWDGSRAWR